MMNILFLAVFIGGLLVGVWIMIAGVERPRDAHPAGERSFRLSPPVLAAMATLFGLVGYILARRQVGTVYSQLAISAIVAAVVGFITARLVRDWWKVTPEHETDDERYVLQGHVARLTKGVGNSADGEVSYVIGNTTHVLPARGIDATVLSAGSEVVIERIEDGIAYVESWAEVEKRL